MKAVEIWGVKPWAVMRREILPNLITPLMVEVGLRLTYSVVIIASLSFFGFGQQPPAPNWGVMINENRIGIVANPWSVIVPVMLLVVLTIGINTFTDAITRVAIGVDRPTEEAMLMEGLPWMASRESFPGRSAERPRRGRGPVCVHGRLRYGRR